MKHGMDLQAQALRAGGRPGDPGWGSEPPDRHGTLTTDAGGLELRGRLASEPGAYQRFYTAMAAAVAVRERGIDAVTVADIAAATGVSRQLLYVHFENRAGLLKAMARRHDVRSGFAGRAAETGALPPVAALERLLRLWFAYLPEILPVARALEAAAVNGDEGGLAWRDRMGDLRELFAAAVGRVAGDGRLAAGWTTTTATDWVWARAQPATFAHLVVDRAWPAADYTDRAVRSILSEVVSPKA